jgi:RecA-family ATPase
MLSSESITELYAWRGTGKTLLSLSLGLHLAAGKDMPRFTIPTPKKVLYIEGELPESQLKDRLSKLSVGLEIQPGNFNVTSKARQGRSKDQSSVTIKTEAGRSAIEGQIKKLGAEVLIS